MSIFEEVERFLVEHAAPTRLREDFASEIKRYEKMEHEQVATPPPKVVTGPGTWVKARRGY